MTRYYHNPRCSKSRQGLQLLQDMGTPLTLIHYLETGLTEDELNHIIEVLEQPLSELIRHRDAKALNIQTKALNKASLIKTLTTHPQLLERPLLVTKTAAIIGRPPERFKSALQPSKT